jgi:hypothetical protein
VYALALSAEQVEELAWFRAGGAEPVRYASVELRRFAGREHQIMFTENEPQSPVEDITPFVALVGL